jgi:hypothetical protein
MKLIITENFYTVIASATKLLPLSCFRAKINLYFIIVVTVLYPLFTNQGIFVRFCHLSATSVSSLIHFLYGKENTTEEGEKSKIIKIYLA